VLDCVTSLGGTPVKLDDWQVDAAYSGTQKCLSCPPGLSPVSFSEKAEAKLKSRKTPVQSWYLDLTMIQSYWGGERAYHHTAPITMNYALYESLRIVFEEGLEARFARHKKYHEALKAGLSAMGLEYAADPDCLLPQLNAVSIPEGVDDGVVRKKLLADYNLEIGGGLGAHKGKVWRIGLMGESCRRDYVMLVLTALEENLSSQGYAFEKGLATHAAAKVLDA
jgi:alanine-glyoxylate transaminase/serine-glyoxylate transaminase/serine-pyruvate transaminase